MFIWPLNALNSFIFTNNQFTRESWEWCNIDSNILYMQKFNFRVECIHFKKSDRCRWCVWSTNFMGLFWHLCQNHCFGFVVKNSDASTANEINAFLCGFKYSIHFKEKWTITMIWIIFMMTWMYLGRNKIK